MYTYIYTYIYIHTYIHIPVCEFARCYIFLFLNNSQPSKNKPSIFN